MVISHKKCMVMNHLKTASFPLALYRLEYILIVINCNRKFKISVLIHVHGIYILVLATGFEKKRVVREHTSLRSIHSVQKTHEIGTITNTSYTAGFD